LPIIIIIIIIIIIHDSWRKHEIIEPAPYF